MVRPELRTPPKPTPGARVAVVSPSWAGPGAFPEVHQLAMRRLRDEIGVEPIEYPTTARLGASAQQRAADLVAAFSDPSIGAVLATIGGDDQLTVLPFLDVEAIAANPKPYFGYSDNTNLLNWLWNLGIVSYHGGSTMVHLGRGGRTHPVSVGSLRSALFTTDEVELAPVDAFAEDPIGWDTPQALTDEPPMRPSEGWFWHNASAAVEGPTWGGNLEVLHWNLAAGRWIRPAEDYAGCILILETSEEMPPATEVFRMLRNLGERGVLEQVAAVVVGRPKASHFPAASADAERRTYVSEQRDAVLRALDAYAPDVMAVFGPDIGHTDPQWIVPYGGSMRIDGEARTIHVRY
ncbi:MAG TPA: S66 peptidase family protein [Candidatus Angelobacter sp.]|nr:S66 peptidase family protein [Candidatus Angelobacter sp.]